MSTTAPGEPGAAHAASQLPDAWRLVRLGDVLKLRKEVVHPQDNPKGPAKFVGLEHIESGTGRRTGCVDLEMASLTGRKPRFYRGDLVYGYLRPYLNKVWVAEFDGLCSVDQYVYRVNAAKADVHYLAWFMRSPVYLRRSPVGQTPGWLPRIRTEEVASVKLGLPPLPEQRRIVAALSEELAAVQKARAATEERLRAASAFPAALVREAIRSGHARRLPLRACLTEVKSGIGSDWSKYPVWGATRAGLAPAKEGVGKSPERYKLVDPVTVFYNPMRILLGSIAVVDEGDTAGITSPDYVVIKGRPGVLDTRWFYYWFRSQQGAHLIDSLSRGAVRERILFNRLVAGKINLPDYETQRRASEQMKEVRPLIQTIARERQAIDALPIALLRRAFHGEL
jgi:type I restriction enzyme, S subunit